MAIGIPNFPNIDTTDPTNYPNGSIRDAATGVAPTPVNRLTNGDIQMFFDKEMRVAGITPNNLPDDETNGYQLRNAAANGFPNPGPGPTGGAGGAWTPFGASTWAATGGSLDVSGSKTVYSRYKIMGKTMFVQIQVRAAVITGTITDLVVLIPQVFTNLGSYKKCMSIWDGTSRTEYYVQLNHPGAGLNQIYTGPSSFSLTGVFLDIDIDFTAEIN